MPKPGWNTGFVLSACLIVLLMRLSARAQMQGSTSLDISMQMTSSISLVFNSYPGGCPLSNSGTSSVGLNLGWADNFSPGYSGCGTYSGGNGTTYTVSTPFYLDVEVQNSSSTQYDLRVWMSAPTPIPGKVNFLLNGATLTNTRPAGAQQTNSYGPVMETFGISVQKQVAATALNFTAQFEATAR
ncbi:MAG: hypothetical protein ABSD88_02655 [Candidatus Korobacteraceae bacterium]|jgi:hypothetical protein